MAEDLRSVVVGDQVLQWRPVEAQSFQDRCEFLHSGCQLTSLIALPRANKDRSSINLKLLAIQLILCWLAFVSPATAGGFEVLPEVAITIDLTTEERLSEDFPTKIAPFYATGASGEFVGKEGKKIRYRTFALSDRTAERGAIVISSGRTEGMIKYQELIYDLSRQGYSVYIHDHRGQGYSERINPKKPELGLVESFDYYVDDLNTFVETVVKPANHKRLFLLAHSMGGAVASLYLARYPEVFRAAVLSSPMHQPSMPGPAGSLCTLIRFTSLFWGESRYVIGKESWTDADKDKHPFDRDKNDLTHSNARYDRMIEQYRQTDHEKLGWPSPKLGGPSPKWAKEACRAGSLSRSEPIINAIKTPILLLQAGGDTIVSLEAQVEFCDKVNQVRNASCKGYQVAKARHELFIESDTYRQRALAAAIDFFHKHSE